MNVSWTSSQQTKHVPDIDLVCLQLLSESRCSALDSYIPSSLQKIGHIKQSCCALHWLDAVQLDREAEGDWPDPQL